MSWFHIRYLSSSTNETETCFREVVGNAALALPLTYSFLDVELQLRSSLARFAGKLKAVAVERRRKSPAK